MQKKDISYITNVEFQEQTPEMLIGEVRGNALYEKAFLSREEASKSEFARNTTTWD